MRMPVPKLRLWLVRRAVLAGQDKPRAWHAAQPCERRRDCAYVDAAVVAVKGLYMVSWIGMQSGLEVHEVTWCVGWMRVGDKGPDARGRLKSSHCGRCARVSSSRQLQDSKSHGLPSAKMVISGYAHDYRH
jgi:hypothetical protein